MSGRGGRGYSRGGRGGGGGRGGRGRGRGYNYSGHSSASKKGLCSALGNNVFDYGTKGAADQMRTSWEKICQYVGTEFGQDIANELQNKQEVTLTEPTYSQAVITRHNARLTVVRTAQTNLQTARQQQLVVLQATLAGGGADPDVPVRIATLENEIAFAALDAQEPVPMELTDEEKTQYSNAWRTYRERKARLEKNRGQAYSLILGQCTQLLQDRFHQDNDWNTVSASFDPLQLYRLIEKTILAQTEDQYPFATVYDQEVTMYNFRQESMNNAQWYEKFNTKVDVANAVGVTRQHKVLNEYVAQQEHGQEYEQLNDADKETVREDAEERYLSYVMLRQSGKQHATLKMDLQNDFTTGDNRYPKNRQQTLHLLDKYTKPVVQRQNTSEGSTFVTKSDAGDGGKGKGKGKGKEGQRRLRYRILEG